MSHKIKSYVLALFSILTLALPVIAPIAVYAASGCGNNNIASNVADGATTASGAPTDTINCTASNVGTGSIGTLAASIVKIFSLIVGAVSVIMIIYGGFRYITSGGDSNRVGSAKNTLIYAVIGLLIVALAQLIVHFVLNQSTNITNSTSVSQ